MDIVSQIDNQVKDAKPCTTTDQNLQAHEITISRQNSTFSESSLESVLTDKEDDADTSVVPNQGEGKGEAGSDIIAMPQPSPRIIIPSGYDPARVPGSVFASKTASPMEWSFASNESLFSLHMGNTSLSKDQFMSMYKSGDLSKFDQELARFSGVMSNDQYNIGSESFEHSYAEITPLGLSKEADHFDWTYDVTPPTFQFPVLLGGYDGTIVTSPTMEPERHWMTQKKQQCRSLGQIMHERDQQQRAMEAKRENHHQGHQDHRRHGHQNKQHHRTSNWLFCFTAWLKPCRGCMAYLKH